MKIPSSFHAQHAPMGAHSSFTVGLFGAKGGMALGKGGPAGGGVFAGYRKASGKLYQFPFFEEEVSEDMERFVQSDKDQPPAHAVFGDEDIAREYAWATDCFRAPGMAFSIATPFFPIPDPATASTDELKFASCPAIFLVLTIENTDEEEWEGFFALQNEGQYWSPLPAGSPDSLKGFMSHERIGFATQDEGVEFCDFSVERALQREHTNPVFRLGSVAGIAFRVPPGERRELNLVLGGYMEGRATFNHASRFWYTRHFGGLLEVLSYALENCGRYMAEVAARDVELAASGLSAEQQFLIAHATRSYYGSTAWLTDGEPLWVVNEGEYLMMNTLDLTVDMMFFELEFNPWTVRNVLEQFVDRYSYVDQIFSPDAPGTLYPGGISFTHDMGVGSHFSPEGHSSYECGGLDRKCFSCMTCEQLANWVLCAGLYMAKTGDTEFLGKYRGLFHQCQESLLNRDHPDPGKRNGLMGFESARTQGGGEITTYDSLDHSLGQARGNVYLAGKCWAAYLALEKIFGGLGEAETAGEARAAASRCAAALENSFDEQLGFIPAVLESDNESAIIPAVEALIYPWQMGLKEAVTEDGPYGGYIRMLKRHTANILKPGICLYEDGGWKLSSSADNSWMSKICLSQFVVREILDLRYEGEERADTAHVQWEAEGAKCYACSDQFSSGRPIGSRYYPRIVTSILWMSEGA
jgi:hypothetical protein